jgi:undecaprenyl-diphosphooligosaccharide---protein glycotransferase
MHWLKLQEERISLKLTWLLIAIAYAFSVGFRLFLSNYTSVEGLKKTGEFLNTPDGYFFAKGALDLLHPEREQTFSTPTGSLLPQVTAFLAKFLPLNFETLIFFMPAFAASLIVIPLVLIGHSIRQTTMGFIAALMGSVAHSYYIRSQTGYYDTDMLTVALPMFATYFIIAGVISRQKFFLILIAITVAISQWWYPQAYSLNTALFAGTILYTLVFDKKNLFNYQIAFFLLLGIIGFAPTTKIILAICLFAFFYYQPKIGKQIFWPLFSVTFIYFAASGGIDPLLAQLSQYLIRGDEVTTSSLQFYNVISTVREAGQIPFSVFANRISGHLVVFLLSCLGYGLALLVYRPLLFTLPMLSIGFLSLFGGLRFTIYAAPIIALGLGYLTVLITQFMRPLVLRHTAAFMIVGLALYANYTGVRTIRYLGVFNEPEIAVLTHFSNFTKPSDYIISWWDYGHPLRYYTNAHAFIDGNKHSGDVNLPVAFALTDGNLTAAAHMLRIAAEHDYYIRTHKTITGYIERHMALNKISDPNQFLEAIADEDYPLPQKNIDIFLVLPYRMMDLLNTIQLFSNINLSTGQQKKSNFFLATRNFEDNKDSILLENRFKIDKNNWIVYLGNQTAKIASITTTQYQNGSLNTQRNMLHPDGQLNLIFMKNYNTVILADNKIANSAFIKLFVLEEADPRYFEPFIITPLMKIFKLKI